MILVSFFSEDSVLSDEIKICYIFDYQSNENQEFRLFWDTWYRVILISFSYWKYSQFRLSRISGDLTNHFDLDEIRNLSYSFVHICMFGKLG